VTHPLVADVNSLVQRWQDSWRGLGISTTPILIREFDELMFRYSEPHRKYHTARHLVECFTRLDEIRHLAPHSAEVEIAIWFHDAILQRRASDNENRSAQLAESTARAAGVDRDSARRIGALVLATRHDAVPGDDDARVVVDVDLAILGEAPDRYDAYENQIRWEYSWVPGSLFRKQWRNVLSKFLTRPGIFSTQPFRERYERQARANIERSLARMAGRGER